MTWYFNFCAPTIPNDSTISFHRGFQTAELIVMFLIFAVLHTYYKLCGSSPLSTESSDESENNESIKFNQFSIKQEIKRLERK